MQLTCEHCSKSFDLPEHKVPGGQKLRFACPACGEKNVVNLKQGSDNSNKDSKEKKQSPEVDSSKFEITIEPDMYPPGSEVAFIFVYDSVWEERAKQHWEAKGYYVSLAEDKNEAVQKIALNKYSIILIEDVPENKPLLQEIANWPGDKRREINCIIVGGHAESFDPQQAFINGVNSYINIEQRDNIEELLNNCQENFRIFLEPWKLAETEEA